MTYGGKTHGSFAALRMTIRTTDLLRSVDLFESLSSEDLEQLSYCAHERRVSAGDAVCGEAMFVVVDGSIEVMEDGAAGRREAGQYWGELGLISGQAAKCTGRAVVDSRVLELNKEEFDSFVVGRPAAMRGVLSAVSRRAVQANQQLLADESRDPSGASGGRIIAVFSPRGGSGKTTVAMRLGLELAERTPKRVALFDLDLLFDDAAFQLDAMPEKGVGSLTEAQIQHLDARAMTEMLAEHRGGLRVLVGATRPEEGELVTPAHVRAVLGALKRQFLVTVVDCASTFSEPTLAALELADRVFVVCTPELATLRDVQECQRLFAQALHVERGKVSFLLNHPQPTTGLTRRQFEDAFEQKMLLEIEHAGESASKSSFSRTITQLADELVPAPRERTRVPKIVWLRGAKHGH